MENSSWQKIFSSPDIHGARLIKIKLESEGIQVVLMDKKDSAYVHLGEIQLFVPQDQVVKALHLIKKFQSNE